jgi:hypothetical protein
VARPQGVTEGFLGWPQAKAMAEKLGVYGRVSGMLLRNFIFITSL